MKRGEIAEKDYLAWAQPHFLLPILDDGFFESSPPMNFVHQISVNYSWSPECVPVGYWNGVTYIGCLAPPSDLPKRADSWCFLLASQEQLEQWWQKIGPQLSQHCAADPALALAHSVDTSTAPSAHESDPFESISAIKPLPLAKDEFAGARSNNRNLKSEITQSLIQTKREPDLSSLTANEPPAKSLLLEASKKSKDSLTGYFDQCFGRLKRYYAKNMIWMTDGNQVLPFYWDTDFVPDPTAQKKPISLATPSIFRIVHRSHQPYHGYIVLNDINEEFVNNWNGGLVPEHITITPIIINSELHGMILSVGGPDISLRQSLQLCVAASKQLAYDITENMGVGKINKKQTA